MLTWLPTTLFLLSFSSLSRFSLLPWSLFFFLQSIKIVASQVSVLQHLVWLDSGDLIEKHGCKYQLNLHDNNRSNDWHSYSVPHSKYITYTNQPAQWFIVLLPSYKKNWGTEKWNNLPRVTANRRRSQDVNPGTLAVICLLSRTISFF